MDHLTLEHKRWVQALIEMVLLCGLRPFLDPAIIKALEEAAQAYRDNPDPRGEDEKKKRGNRFDKEKGEENEEEPEGGIGVRNHPEQDLGKRLTVSFSPAVNSANLRLLLSSLIALVEMRHDEERPPDSHCLYSQLNSTQLLRILTRHSLSRQPVISSSPQYNSIAQARANQNLSVQISQQLLESSPSTALLFPGVESDDISRVSH